jgi:hypothetical protein
MDETDIFEHRLGNFLRRQFVRSMRLREIPILVFAFRSRRHIALRSAIAFIANHPTRIDSLALKLLAQIVGVEINADLRDKPHGRSEPIQPDSNVRGIPTKRAVKVFGVIKILAGLN